jgi:hypothetical protein
VKSARIERLDEVAEGPVLDGIGRAADGGSAGDEDDRQVAIVVTHRTQEVDAIETGQLDVADDDLEAPPVESTRAPSRPRGERRLRSPNG